MIMDKFNIGDRVSINLPHHGTEEIIGVIVGINDIGYLTFRVKLNKPSTVYGNQVEYLDCCDVCVLSHMNNHAMDYDRAMKVLG